MNKPFLVQRGKFKKTTTFTGIDSLIAFDYMGSAEFEFGALPKALKEICAILPQLGFKWTNITYGKKHLWLFCKAEDELPLVEFWNMVINDKFSVRCKELLFYDKKIGEDGVNFWWDLENCWMAALGEDEIQKVHDALVMVKQKKGW